MTPRLIIGLVAPKGGGKDTFADAVSGAPGFARYSFADPIKEACRSVFLLEKDDLEDRTKKEAVDERWGISRRTMMQVLGTECIRAHFGEGHWIKHLKMRLNACKDKVAIVTDVRFENEAKALRDYVHEGCRTVLVRILRPGSSHATDTHASEISINDIKCNMTVFNDGTVSDLQTQAVAVVMSLLSEI